MSVGPPFDESNESTDRSQTWENWREDTRRLDYDGRDIRVLWEAERVDRKDGVYHSPADFGDFDPKPSDPDSSVWPLKELDPGYPAPVDELILWSGTFPEPHVAWVTEEYLQARYGAYDPMRQEVDVEVLPLYLRPDGWEEGDTVEIVATNETAPSMSLTDDRLEALRRIGELWNGNEVRGHHLLVDKCPSWEDVLGDLDQEELKRLVIDPNVDVEFAEAFSEHDWYEQREAVYTKPQRILRKKVWWAPTQRGRTLITNTDELPNLIGDSLESLRHRVTVGLTALREIFDGKTVMTYKNIGSFNWVPVSRRYNVDVFSYKYPSPEAAYAGEVITGHHNYQLHEETYQKLAALNRTGITPYVIFDSRDTAYRVFNYWHRNNNCSLPLGTFDSDAAISWGRQKIQEAYEDDTVYWAVADWSTTDRVWRSTLGPDGPDISRSDVVSYNW
ncbi:hypothetical protein [Halobellus ordinarius]|uniref:hypothetical protein n=1 Tax=Halobellus ordinarius TaxID=3075120 RepID=UPI0028806497|nr:hypothetical protein [Halobellus sp. ZY16]